MKKLLKFKTPEGKWLSVGSYEMGQYGPRIGVNRSALRQVLDGDGWANLSVFDEKPKEPVPAPHNPTLDDEIPF